MSELRNQDNKPLYTPKKLIVCCDGTWRNSDSAIFTGTGLSWLWRGQEQIATNVTKISRAICNTDRQGRQQIVYYQAGVGSAGNLLERLVGGALGVGLSVNIREAYSFLANNYVDGDEIFLLGFSRGAFTARSIGGLIGDLGFLTTEGQEHLVDVFEDWENAGRAGYKTLLSQHNHAFPLKVGAEDPKAYCKEYREGLVGLGYSQKREIPIKAIGVWETVGSLGIPVNPLLQRLGLPTVLRAYRFYDTDLGRNVENAFQALALDEARAAYRPTLWQKPAGIQTNLKQTWFPGVHSDIGGGHPDTGLSNITLAWMMSNLAPFIDFTPDFIRVEREKNLKYLREEKVPFGGLKWAASQLQNTSSGLRALLGIVRRSPGRYHVFNRKTRTITQDKPLQNTNELVHVSVRSRERTGGLNQHNRLKTYRPKALGPSDYQLIDPEADPTRAVWRYVGKVKPFTGELLPEDQLGVFEKEIFEDYMSKRQPR